MASTAQTRAPDELRPIVSLNSAREQDFHRRVARISRQSSVYFAGTIFTAMAGYPFKIYLAWKLGAEALGIYALGMTIVGLLGLFNALGLPTAAARFVSSYSGRGEFQKLGAFLRGSLSALTATNVVLGLVVLVTGPWVAVHIYHLPALSPYLWAFALIMFFGVLNTFLGQVMAGYQDVARRTLITHFIGTPANILFTVILVSFGFRLSGYLAAQVLSALLVVCLLASACWKMTPRLARAVRSFAAEKEVFAFSATAFATTALEFVLAQADKIVLGYFLSAAQVGIYAVAGALVAFVPIALQSVNQIFSPTIAELHAVGNTSLLQQLYSTLTKWILILTLPLALTLVILPRQFIGIFGPAFAPGASVLVIGAIGQLFNCAVGSVGFLLLMSGNQNALLKIQAVNALLMLILMLALVPSQGVTGAASATAITVAVSNLCYLRAVRRRLGLFPFNRQYLKLAPAAVFCALVLAECPSLLRQIGSNWILAPVCLLAAYISFLAALSIFGLDRYDREVGRLILMKAVRPFQKGTVPA